MLFSNTCGNVTALTRTIYDPLCSFPLFSERFRGMQSVIICGDEFVRKSAKQRYMKMSDCYGTSKYEILIGAADMYNSHTPFITSRIINSVTKQLNECANMPKFIILIIEDDIIKDVGLDEPAVAAEFFEEYLEYIIKEITKLLKRFEFLLPEYSRQLNWPKLVFIAPTLHRNYEQNNLKLRQKFGVTLDECTAGKNNCWALRLLQIWDKNNLNLVRSDSNQITGEGISYFWRAVDRTLKFCDRKLARIEANQESNPYQLNRNVVQTPTTINRPDIRKITLGNRVWRKDKQN